MWTIVALTIVGVWLFFFVKARPLARTIDRGEVCVLKSLATTYLVLAVTFGLTRAWLMLVCTTAAWLVNGAIGAALHKERSFAELAGPLGTLAYMRRGSREELSTSESHQLTRVLFGAAAVLGLLLSVALLYYTAIRWYLAFPAAYLAAYIFLVFWAFVVAYQRPKRATQ